MEITIAIIYCSYQIQCGDVISHVTTPKNTVECIAKTDNSKIINVDRKIDVRHTQMAIYSCILKLTGRLILRAFETRSKHVWNTFKTRSKWVWNAFKTRSKHIRNAFKTRWKPVWNVFKCVLYAFVWNPFCTRFERVWNAFKMRRRENNGNEEEEEEEEEARSGKIEIVSSAWLL